MPEWMALSRRIHARQHYRPRQDYHHTAGQMAAPVIMAELHKLSGHYAVALLPMADSMVPVALLGIDKGQNLYLHPDGRWQAGYVPALLRCHPFGLADSHADGQTVVIDAGHLSAAGEPLFNHGALNTVVADNLRFLHYCEQSRHAATAAGRALKDAGVVAEWPLTVPVGESHKRINGLYRVDEQALNALDAETYATLQGAPMQLAYAQLYSQSQVEQLTRRAEIHAQLEKANTTPDLEAMFGEDDDEPGFDFD